MRRQYKILMMIKLEEFKDSKFALSDNDKMFMIRGGTNKKWKSYEHRDTVFSDGSEDCDKVHVDNCTEI